MQEQKLKMFKKDGKEPEDTRQCERRDILVDAKISTKLILNQYGERRELHSTDFTTGFSGGIL
jgi:hypothetical protein